MTDLEHRYKLLFGDTNSIPVHRVHHVDNGICVAIVTSPIWPANTFEK